MLHSVYDQPDADNINAQFDRLLDNVDEKLPATHEHLDNTRADILTFTKFPKRLQQQIWSNNPNKRLNREIHRHTDSVQIFPNPDAITRLAAAILAEQTDERPKGRHHLEPDILTKSHLTPIPDTTPKETTDTILELNP